QQGLGGDVVEGVELLHPLRFETREIGATDSEDRGAEIRAQAFKTEAVIIEVTEQCCALSEQTRRQQVGFRGVENAGDIVLVEEILVAEVEPKPAVGVIQFFIGGGDALASFVELTGLEIEVSEE